MSQDCDFSCMESFNSFLAGVLLTKNNISNLDLLNLQLEFENRYNVCIYDNNDFIDVSISISDTCVGLLDQYDDIIWINNKKMTVSEYLYSLTSNNVREFFKLSINDEKRISLGNTKKLIRMLTIVK